eukprot:15650907-Heterocapsa_arctica.AAC.1
MLTSGTSGFGTRFTGLQYSQYCPPRSRSSVVSSAARRLRALARATWAPILSADCRTLSAPA